MTVEERDLKYIWHPCSQMKDYETFPPIPIERGEGVYLYGIGATFSGTATLVSMRRLPINSADWNTLSLPI